MCHLLVLLAHHILHVSGLRVKLEVHCTPSMTQRILILFSFLSAQDLAVCIVVSCLVCIVVAVLCVLL